MAYREFYDPSVVNTEPTYVGFSQGLSNLFGSLAKKQEDRRKKADQFDYDLNEGAFENDQRILTELAQTVTNKAKDELRRNGALSVDTDNLMKEGLGWQQQSKTQLDRAKQIRQRINDKASKDKYYNPQLDEDLIQDAVYGRENEVDFRTRGERLKAAENAIGGIDTFKYNDYRADYVKNIGTQYKEIETPMKDGSSRTKYNQATFWDDDKGVPGVTDKHAIDFMESDGRVSQYYENKMSRQLDNEIKQMRSSKDERTSWMNKLSDEEVKLELIKDPSKNLINNQDFGVRMRDMAKSDLSEADRINSKVSYTGLSNDKNNSGGRWSNNNILHTNTVNQLAQEAKTPDGAMQTVTTYGPGGRFTQKSGRPIRIDTTNPVRTDTDRGVTTNNNKGNLQFNLTGYMLMPTRQRGAPLSLKSSSPEAMVEEIQNLPLEYFDPEGKMALKPDMQIGMVGYTINEAGVLNDIQDQLVNLSSQMAEARRTNNKDQLANLESMEYELNELKNMIGSGDYDQQDLILAGNKAGVRKIQNNYIIPAQDSDVATIKNYTGGFDLKDKSYWSPEMLMVEEAYKKRYNEAKQKNFGRAAESQSDVKSKPTAKASIPTVLSDADYAKLPSGSEYIGPDGKKRRKK